jgi:hypothetical protein
MRPAILEKFVRPAQQPNIRPPRQSTERSSAKDAIVKLKIDLTGGSAGPKILVGAFSHSQSFYVEAYVNEAQFPLSP